MYRAITHTVLALGLVAVFNLATPNIALAQDVQNNESDVDFLKRMTSSLKRTEKRSEKLEEMIDRMGRQASQNALSRGDSLESQQDRYGSMNRNTTGNRNSDYRRAEMRARSINKKTIREREKIVELQRSHANLDEKDREDIEKTVTFLENEVKTMERDMHLGRF